MKVYKKLWLVFASIAIIFVCCSGFTNIYTETKILLPQTQIYKEADADSEVLTVLSMNDAVTLIGEPVTVGDFLWQKISAHSIEGYVLSNQIYVSRIPNKFSFKQGKARSSGMGQRINLYNTYDGTEIVATTTHDAKRIKIVDNGVNYGEYRLVEVDGEYYFAKKDNITTALSYNETLAVIIGCSAFCLIVIGVVIFFAIRRKKSVLSQKKKPQTATKRSVKK